eukprot:scaffold12_cov128-Skeletonema_dohrnii-CCMP3373.AAC.4
MDDENVASSTAPPVEAAEGDGGTKCFVCKKRVGRKIGRNCSSVVGEESMFVADTNCIHLLQHSSPTYTFLNFDITKNTIIIIQTASNQPASNAAPTQPVNPTAKPEKHSAKPNPSSPALTQ